jgi:hypothetical protein
MISSKYVPLRLDNPGPSVADAGAGFSLFAPVVFLAGFFALVAALCATAISAPVLANAFFSASTNVKAACFVIKLLGVISSAGLAGSR